MSPHRPIAVVADVERIPFAAAAERILVEGGVEPVYVAGHDRTEVLATGHRASALLVRHGRWDDQIFTALPELRVIARCGTGYDNIDVVAARRRAIVVTFVPEYGTDDVADHALALGLDAARRIAWSDAQIRAGRWPHARDFPNARRVSGRTVGIIGLGRIGLATARRWQAFGARLLAYDPFRPAAPAGVELVTLEALLARSHLVSIHCPLTEQTRGLLGHDQLAQLPRGAVLINTSRGELIDERALNHLLESGHIGAAALDVFESEPLPDSSPLRLQPNVVLTPHSAAFTTEALEEVSVLAARDVVNVLSGAAVEHEVQP